MIREGTYRELSSRIHGSVSTGREPLTASIELTRRCPLVCQHCYNNLPMSDASARRAELSFDEVCRILDEMAELGVMWLLLTGGEFFARRDALEIYLHARRRGLIVTIFTNATVVNEKIADTLSTYPPFCVEVTLYGFSRETYEAVTQVPGSYDKCIRGIRLLLDRKVPLKLKTVALNLNAHEMLDMKAWVEKELGLEFKFDGMINPRIDCSQSPLATRLSPEELVRLDFLVPERLASYRELAAIHVDTAVLHQDFVYACGGGVTSFAVDPYGKMSICVLSEVDKYDVRHGSLREGWEEFLLKVRGRKATRPTKCTSCSIKAVCGMCPANAELENGDPEAPVSYLCEVAHLRAIAFDIPIKPHGDCEFCRGGSRHDSVCETADRLRIETPDISAPVAGTRAASDPSPCGNGACSDCSLGLP